MKAGLNVQSDLTRLNKQWEGVDLSSPRPSVADYIKMADWCELLRPGSRRSLQGLLEDHCDLYLDKPAHVQCSEQWEQHQLSDEHKRYAACDVWAGYLLYTAIVSFEVQERPSKETQRGRQVDLYDAAGQVCAQGSLTEYPGDSLCGVKVKNNPKRTVVLVERMHNPTAHTLLHYTTDDTQRRRGSRRQPRTLGSFRDLNGDSPFFVVWLYEHLSFTPQDSSSDTFAQLSEDSIAAKVLEMARVAAAQDATPEGEAQRTSSTAVGSASGVDEFDRGSEIYPTAIRVDGNAYPEDDTATVADLRALADSGHADAQGLHNYSELGPHPHSCWKDQLLKQHLFTGSGSPAPQPSPPASTESCLSPEQLRRVFIRHLKDHWHAMDQIKIPVHHGLRPKFLRALRDVLLDWDQQILKEVDARCRTVFGRSAADMMKKNHAWLKKRVPRHARAPEELSRLLRALFDYFQDLHDARTKRPLFDTEARNSANSLIKLALAGHLSDPPDVQLYQVAHTDRDGFTVYRCIRGSSKVEGGPHSDIYKKFGSLNCRPLL